MHVESHVLGFALEIDAHCLSHKSLVCLGRGGSSVL